MVVGYYLKYGWKTAFASPENKPTFLHTHKLIRKIGGWMPNKDDIGTERWNNVISKVNDKLFNIHIKQNGQIYNVYIYTCNCCYI